MRALGWLVVLLVGLFMTSVAGAEAPVERAPRDVPLVLEPREVKLPPLHPDMVSKTHDWLTIAFPSSVEGHVEPLFGEADAFKTKLSVWLAQPVLQHLELRIARSPEDMAGLAPANNPPPPYADGVAYPSLHLVLLSLREPRNAEATDLSQVLRHELVHVALEDAVEGHHVPLWFNEGLAVYGSGEHFATRLDTLWQATLSKSVLSFDELDRSFPAENQSVSIAYAQSADFVRFLLRDEDRARFGSLIERVRKGAPFDRALTDAYATNLHKLEYEWREDLDKRFTLWPVITGSSTVWALIMGVLVIAYVKRKRKARETLARWAKEEADEDRARVKLLVAAEPSEVEPVGPLGGAHVPAVQHDGEWHILH